MTRTAERETFYADVIITALEGGYTTWAEVSKYRWYSSVTRGGSASPQRKGGDNAHAVLRVADDDQKLLNLTNTMHLTPSDIARAFIGIRKVAAGSKPNEYEVHQSYITRLNAAWVESDCGELDAIDCDIVVQIAAFGKVIYG